ncbi:MAG: calcium-binding protein, partial [Merismopedia sp. SIO2A8]|nr:calcium-binding protein [Merismopedia sp. SIO2A8]
MPLSNDGPLVNPALLSGEAMSGLSSGLDPNRLEHHPFSTQSFAGPFFAGSSFAVSPFAALPSVEQQFAERQSVETLFPERQSSRLPLDRTPLAQNLLNRLVVRGRNQRIVGTRKADRINASKGKGKNWLLGRGGNDRILVNKRDTAKGQGGQDYLDARKGKGLNRLYGGQGNDTLLARKRDRLFGNRGDDLLDARHGTARNRLNGGQGNDILYAGPRWDELTGGSGSDQFWLGTQQLPLKPHTVRDFQPGRDRLGFDAIPGLKQFSDLTLTASGSHTTIQFQGRAIATLRNVSPQDLNRDDVLIVNPAPDGSDALVLDMGSSLDEINETNGTVRPPLPSAAMEPGMDPSEPVRPTDPDPLAPDPSTLNPSIPEDNAPQPDITLFSTYRKDYFFPNEVYDENTPEPLTGGRVQIAAIATVSGQVSNVVIDGVEWQVIYEPNPAVTPPFEWVHVWPQTVEAGEPIWVNFHSRDAKWDTITHASLQVATNNGLAVDGYFAPTSTPAPLTYVTTTDNYSTLLIHAQNTDSSAHHVEHLWVNGVDVLTMDSSATDPSDADGVGESILPNRILAAHSHALWEIPLVEPTSPGEAWTVVVEYANAPAAVGTGRVIPEFFPVMAWNNTSERPFPSGELDNYLNIRQAGIDTIFIHEGTCNGGGCDLYDVINNELPSVSDAGPDPFGAFITYDRFVAPEQNVPDFTDTSGIVAVMTGDESDDSIYDENGIPVPAIKAEASRNSWQRYPELPTFNGGKTNKLIGTFAGMSDIQGIDFYTAAGAPHVTEFGNHPPLRATFDYLRNTRNNHMPLTTWMYTQGLSPAWNRSLGFSFQPDPQEILAQGMMAIAAGAKGLAWFQVNQREAAKSPERWEAIADMNSIVRAVRPWLREGDVTGGATSDPDTLVELIHAPDALIVPIISLDTVEEPTDLGFFLAETEDEIPRWIFDEST